MSNNDTLCVGVDDGHNEIKVFTINPFTGEEIKIKIPSKVIQGQGSCLGTVEEINKTLISVNNKIFTVDPNIDDAIDTRTEDYPMSDYNIALIYQALRIANLPCKNLHIATGLPLDRYYGGENRSQNLDLISAKSKKLINVDVYNKADKDNNETRIKFLSHEVLCEGQGTFVDMLIANKGGDTEFTEILLDHGIGIIDIGGRTTDCLVTFPARHSIKLNGNRSRTKDIGMLNIYEELSVELKSFLSTNKINEIFLKEALKTNFYGIGSKKIDVTHVVNKAKAKIYSQLKNFVEMTIGDGNDLAMLVLTGGGSFLFEEYFLQDFTEIHITEDRSYTNARGFFKALVDINGY